MSVRHEEKYLTNEALLSVLSPNALLPTLNF